MDTIERKLESLKQKLRIDLLDDGAFIPPPPLRRETSAKSLSPVHSTELRNLNLHWGDWTENAPFDSHRKVTGRFFAAVKNRVRGYLIRVIFGEYFHREQQFHADLVRFLNALARHVDARDTEVLYECIRKIDNESRHECARQDMLISEVMRVVRSNGRGKE